MLRFLAAMLAACSFVSGVLPRTAVAQVWNDDRTQALVARATTRRTQQLADTGLVDYHAAAHGYLSFLAQFGEGFSDPPQLVKTDELALEVYWRAPNLSKQQIHGWRDTLMLPADVVYHRDHLGIIQNNFPNVIRLGDGDEVRDIPHPLSPSGQPLYDFAISDSLTIRLTDRTIAVYEVKVRPRDDRAPRAIGSVYLDRETADVVRMHLSFTRAAFRDPQLEFIIVLLENGLYENRFWLPRRQEIEIVRTGEWLEAPLRGIIRGRWEIYEYEINRGIDPNTFVGPEIVELPRTTLDRYPWQGGILEGLPEAAQVAGDTASAAIRAEVQRLVRAEALERLHSTRLAVPRVSDLVRVNRVEGIALGAGVKRTLGNGFSLGVAGRWGIDDHRAKGQATAAWRSASGAGLDLAFYSSLREAGDEPEVSLAKNSIAAQEFGSDYTDPIGAWGASLTLLHGEHGGLRWQTQGHWERQTALAVHATPATGRYEPTLPAWPLRRAGLSVSAERTTPAQWLGGGVTLRTELGGAAYRRDGTTEIQRTGRGLVAAGYERSVGGGRVLLSTSVAGVVGPTIPPQDLVLRGGPVTGPGYGFHTLSGRLAVVQHMEWQIPIPFVSFSLGRFGRTPGVGHIAPFVHGVYLARPAGGSPAGWSPAVGLGLPLVFDVIRVDVARGLRRGRWTFSFDLARPFWSIL